jgi:hypothetical protein
MVRIVKPGSARITTFSSGFKIKLSFIITSHNDEMFNVQIPGSRFKISPGTRFQETSPGVAPGIPNSKKKPIDTIIQLEM